MYKETAITVVTLALALAFEPGEPDIMRRPPRDPKESILTRAGVVRIVYVSLLPGAVTIGVFLLGQSMDAPLEISRAPAVNTLVVGVPIRAGVLVFAVVEADKALRRR